MDTIDFKALLTPCLYAEKIENFDLVAQKSIGDNIHNAEHN